MVAESFKTKAPSHRIKFFALGAASFLALNPVALAAAGFSPLLPLQTDVARDLPLLEEALRDPVVVNGQVHDDTEASRLVQELSEYASDLARAQGSRRAELTERLFEGYAVLSYYLADLASGKLQLASGAEKLANNLTQTRQILVNHATATAKVTKNQTTKSRALYHIFVTRYLLGQSPSQQTARLDELAKGKGKEKLNVSLARRAALLVALTDLDAAGGKKRDAGIASLRALSSGGKLSNEGMICANLALGRALAGLGSRGQKVRKASPAYRTALGAASNRVQGINDSQKERIFSFIMSVWRTAEGKNASWASAPLNLKNFSATTGITALVERSALEDWSSRRSDQAVRKYASLARKYEGKPLGSQFDLRILDLRRSEYAQSKKPSIYEKALLAARAKYATGSDDGQALSAATQEIARRHQALVATELSRAGAKSATQPDRLVAIRLASNYVATLTDAAEQESIRARIGGLYVLNGQHEDAVRVYLALAEQNASGKTGLYLERAAASQSVLASWPAGVPWGGIKAGANQEREQLLALYRKIQDLKKDGLDWRTTSHIGLLSVTLGREQEAFQIWTEALSKSPQGSDAAHAAGFMLVTYQRNKNWPAVESLARQCRDHQIAAVHLNKRQDIYALMANALLENGKASLEAQNYAEATAKLREFTKDFGRAANHDQGFFLLASAYRGDQKHPESIKTLQDFVAQYPKSRYHRSALLNGGDWCLPMAYEENVLWFYGQFLERYGQDENAPRVSDALVELNLGRGLYAEASQVMRWQINSKVTSSGKRTEIARALMRLEEREGDLARAASLADQVIKLASTDDGAKAEAYSTKARAFATKKNMAGVAQVERQLASLDASVPEVQEALGAVRFILADTYGVMISAAIFNLELKNPLQTMNEQYASFAKARTYYDRVCATGRSSYCAAAAFKTARLTENLIKAIEDIEIAETLAKEEVDQFNQRKAGIMNAMIELAEASDAKAMETVKEGYTNPDWTQAILWENSRDWNFDRVSGETGNGYVQWSAYTNDTAKAE